MAAVPRRVLFTVSLAALGCAGAASAIFAAGGGTVPEPILTASTVAPATATTAATTAHDCDDRDDHDRRPDAARCRAVHRRREHGAGDRRHLRPRLGARARDVAVGRDRLRAARMELRPDPGPLLQRHQARAAGEPDRARAARRGRGRRHARLGVGMERHGRARDEGRRSIPASSPSAPGSSSPAAEARAAAHIRPGKAPL